MKALALLSGGLDSTLAIKIILKQNIQVEALNFSTPFCQCSSKANGCGYEAKKVADNLGIPLKIFSATDEFLKVLRTPKHGYGKNMNPCIDCRILMHKKAKEYMERSGASFIITGEVLGQRPMSQHRAALKIIEKESHLEGLILRPLSAKLLTETIPEKEGWVKRDELLDINGRSRKPQMSLAKELSIGDYPCPAGGCLLTDPGFAQRIKDLMRHAELNIHDIRLLKIGRHFRLSNDAKLIVGRNEKENDQLLTLRQKGDIYTYPKEDRGPVAIGRGKFLEEDVKNVARIVARYCDNHKNGNKVKISSQVWPDEKTRTLEVKPADETELKILRI